MTGLIDRWICDQQVALSAAILAGTDLEAASQSELAILERMTVVVAAQAKSEHLAFFSASTLALLEKIPVTYHLPDVELLGGAVPLADCLASVRVEVGRRKDRSQRMSALLTAYAIYLLQQPHLSIRDFLKWLKRSNEPETRALALLLKQLQNNGLPNDKSNEIDSLLNLSRDISAQSRDRIDAVDRLYEALCNLAPEARNLAWWIRICLALRNSLYCWPLMTGGAGSRIHGISLPIGLFLSQDKKSKVFFKVVNKKGAADKSPRYVPAQDGAWAHMEGSKLHWDGAWSRAFHVGLESAKALWRTQNGRLRYVDATAAEAMLNSSLVVDVGAACTIVDAVFRGLDDAIYPVSGRSAEAYWLQAVLGLLLPGGQYPLGVVTGCIEPHGGRYEIHPVEGLRAKLEYANIVGFPRIVLASLASKPDEFVGEEIEGSQTEDQAEFGATGLTSLDGGESIRIPPDECVQNIEMTDDNRKAEEDVSSFLRSLADSRASKGIEINFCENARAAADALQPSGWRRSVFSRLPETQRAFSFNLRRLFLKDQVEQRLPIAADERAFLRRFRWRPNESASMEVLDRHLLSEHRAIKFVERASLERKLAQNVEAAVGKWLAWKDHQVRSKDADRHRGPGLGIVCLRSTQADSAMRLWSALADILSASGEWWDRFEWSDRDQAALLLAQLLGNQRADPSVCLTPAPDVLVLFDEGNLTQKRTNQIFPDDFRGQWLDLLNPTKDDPKADHPLNRALLQLGQGRLGPTRIIVVHGEAAIQQAADLPKRLDADDTEQLQRLAVFRFGFSIHAAYAMMNYAKPSETQLAWTDARDKLDALVRKKALHHTRGQFYVASELLAILRQGPFSNDPLANLHAAKALAPILEPRGLFVASNRDRTLEPEPVLEATWHLHKARRLLPSRDTVRRPQCVRSLSNLTFLRRFPHWDTVQQLQHSHGTVVDAVELGRELLEKERLVTKRPAHISRVALLLNAIGHFGAHIRGSSPERAQDLADEATKLCTDGLVSLVGQSLRRKRRKLLSDYLYCMKMLGVPQTDPQLEGARKFLDDTIREILRPDFYDFLGEENAGLDEYPLSRDWLKSQWSDIALPKRERSTYAYVAARLHIGRWKDGEQIRDPWDQPWVEYFALTVPEDFDVRQLISPLGTWMDVYGHDEGLTQAFSQRVRDFFSYRASKTDQISWWGEKIRAATDNLWSFLNHSEPDKRLKGRPAEAALKFIRAISMTETIPAFDAIRRRGKEDLQLWPQRLGHQRSSEWHSLAAQIVSSQAGWVAMLSSINPFEQTSISAVLSWLQAYRKVGVGLHPCDPEDLLGLRARILTVVDDFRRDRATAIWNGYQLLAQKEDGHSVVSGDFRSDLEEILRAINGDTNGWFFALVDRKPSRRVTAGAFLLLKQHLTNDAVQEIMGSSALDPFRNRLLRNVPEWLHHARGNEHSLFEYLGRQFAGGPVSEAASA